MDRTIVFLFMLSLTGPDPVLLTPPPLPPRFVWFGIPQVMRRREYRVQKLCCILFRSLECSHKYQTGLFCWRKRDEKRCAWSRAAACRWGRGRNSEQAFFHRFNGFDQWFSCVSCSNVVFLCLRDGFVLFLWAAGHGGWGTTSWYARPRGY